MKAKIVYLFFPFFILSVVSGYRHAEAAYNNKVLGGTLAEAALGWFAVLYMPIMLLSLIAATVFVLKNRSKDKGI